MATEAYKETSSENVKKNRDLFGEVTVFANFANKSPVIKQIWKKFKIGKKKLASNLKIFVYNHQSIKLYGVSSRSRILPHYLPIDEAGIGLNENTLTFSFKISEKGIIPETYNDFKAPFIFTAIIRMEEPVDETVKNKLVNIRLEEMLLEADLLYDGFTHFTFNTAKKSFKIINDYNKIIVYPAIISLDSYQQPYKWAECGGIYVKGSDRVYVPPPKPEPVQKPDVYFDIEYR